MSIFLKMNYTVDDIKKWLQNNLSKERFEHSLGTAECAEWLAKKYGIDAEKAYFAGLIHDCAKCLPKEETEKILHNLVLEDGEQENHKTHHAPAGAYLAAKEFGIDDEEILSAIRWHTIGKTNMSLFEKIIFLADKIETRTRPIAYREPIRALLEEEDGIEKALFLCYENTIKSLVDRKLAICTQTIDIYNDLVKKLYP